MAKYHSLTDANVMRDDGASIPANSDNCDWMEFQAWLEAGGVPDPAPPEPVPEISKAQALLYLLSIGKTESDVQAAIASIEDATQRAIAEIEWNYRQPFRYDHPMFMQLGSLLSINDMAAAFRAAKQL